MLFYSFCQSFGLFLCYLHYNNVFASILKEFRDIVYVCDSNKSNHSILAKWEFVDENYTQY